MIFSYKNTVKRILSATHVTGKPLLQKCQEKRIESIRFWLLCFVVVLLGFFLKGQLLIFLNWHPSFMSSYQ